MLNETDFYLLRDFTGDRFVGRLVTAGHDELVFDSVTWIASGGVRDSVLIASGPTDATEAEAYPEGLLTQWPRAAVRLTQWPHGPVTTR